MDLRHGNPTSVILDPRTTTAPARAHVACQSYLVGDADDIRIEDREVAGSTLRAEPAVWRVTYSGVLTDTGAAALRTKCEVCADSAVDSFGPGAVTLRPLNA